MNYMLDPRIIMMQYAGQYILNYNFMYILLAMAVLISIVIVARITWLERQ